MSARNELHAHTILKNQGKYNGTPERYQIEQTRNVGLYTQERCELILESYTNALVAFDAIVAFMLKHPVPTITVEQVAAGVLVEATDENGTTSATLYHGEKGETGAQGVGIQEILLNHDYTLTFKMSNGAVHDTGSVRGPEGPQGPRGIRGEQGEKGDSPVITADEEGNLYSDGEFLTDILAQYDHTKQDVIEDLDTIRAGAAAGATAYQKPQTGIPALDLSQAVQSSLGKADTAVQLYTVTYDVTTGPQIKAAVDAGKKVELKIGSSYESVIPLTGYHYWGGLGEYITAEFSYVDSTGTVTVYKAAYNDVDEALEFETIWSTYTKAIPDIPDVSMPWFDVTYNVTTEAQITTALEAGKLPRLVINRYTYSEYIPLTFADNSVYIFSCISNDFTETLYILDYSWEEEWFTLYKTIPDAQVQSDWNQTSSSAKDYIKNKPDLSLKADKSEMSVTTSGDQTTITLKSGTSATVINQHQSLTSITDLIPSQATSSNQLADKEFVNNSISTATATFCGTYNLLNNLVLPLDATQEQIGTALANIISGEDNNDYAFVQIPTSDLTPEEIARVDRYKYNGTTWVYEYSLNNSGYTAAQWAAINSGITSGLVTKLSDLPTNSALTTSLDGKANKSEMSVVDGSGADADKTTITLKSGTSATVLKSHQDISGKVDKVTGKGLSTEDYTTEEKTKLAGVAAGAQVNVIETVKVNGTALTVSNKAVDISVPTEFSNAEIDAIWEAN